MAEEQTLAQRVRAKYPGAYDDLSDTELEAAIDRKFPGVYDDLPRSQTLMGRAASAVADVAIGAGKGAMNTIGGLGQMARKIPGVNALDNLMTPIPIDTTPANTAQRVGYGAEQIGEFFVPVGGLAGKAKLAADVAKSGVLTLAQGGSPASAGASAALTAVMPAAVQGATKAAGVVSRALSRSAEKMTAQALGATKEGMKATAATLAPEMLKRGVRGSRKAMLEQARAQVSAVGAQIGDEIAAKAAEGATVDGQAVRGAIQLARDALKVKNAAGVMTTIPGAERTVKQLDKMDEFVASLGPDIPFEKAQVVKQTWDRLVSKAGLYTNKATASATDNAQAWAVREGASAFRELLAKGSPTLDDLNREYAFWKGLKTVLSETERRTQAQGGGLVSGITGAAGMAAGYSQGDSMSDKVQNALIGGLAGRQLVKAMQSPWWRTTASAPLKQALADALASGNAERISRAVGRMTVALPARLPQPAQ